MPPNGWPDSINPRLTRYFDETDGNRIKRDERFRFFRFLFRTDFFGARPINGILRIIRRAAQLLPRNNLPAFKPLKRHGLAIMLMYRKYKTPVF